MININIRDNGETLSIEIFGHANYDQHGRDIVCSAISAISQTSILGLRAVANSYPDYVVVNEDISE